MSDGRAGVGSTTVLAAAAALAAGFGVLFGALLWSGALAETSIPGLSDAGAPTRWGLPVSRLLMDLTATLTVGVLLAAVVLLPSHKGVPGAAARAYIRAASWTAAGWAAAAAATVVFTVSDVLGEPVADIVTGTELSSYIGQLPQGTALLLVVLLAVVIALLARTTASAGGALGLLVLACLALLPTPLTGHASSAANHSLAVTSLAMHVLAVTLWAGGLVVLADHAFRRGAADTAAADTGRAALAVSAGRFSRLALWCYIGVGVSGSANMLAQLTGPADLVRTDYGRLLLGKIAAFVVLGGFGWWLRGRTLPLIAKSATGRAGFARFAAAEVLVLSATMGLAVALSRTAPPLTELETDPVRAVLGYAMPPPVTAGRLLTLWQFDFFFAVLAVALAGLYAAGLLRLRRRGDRWPVTRVLAWTAGLTILVLCTQSGVAKYAPILFSVHMGQHMALSMLVPIFLVLGGPVTLALRALKPAAVRGDRGPREWLMIMLHSRAARFFAHPAVATTIFVVSTFALYFTPLFEAAMRNHLGHIAMTLHFLLSGTLFFWLLIGVDPAPRTLPHAARLLLLFVTMPFHAFFGLALMNISAPIAPGWYASVDPEWGTSLLKDQHTGGSIAWAFGEIPTFIVLIALAVQWYVADERTARRLERSTDRTQARNEEDDFSRYNDYLAELERRSRRTPG